MISICDSNGQNCVDVPKTFCIRFRLTVSFWEFTFFSVLVDVDPCAYATPDWLKNNLTHVAIPSSTLSVVNGLLLGDAFDNPSPVLKDTSIVPTCVRALPVRRLTR